MIYAKCDMIILTDYGVEKINKNEIINEKYFFEIIEFDKLIKGGIDKCHLQQNKNILPLD